MHRRVLLPLSKPDTLAPIFLPRLKTNINRRVKSLFSEPRSAKDVDAVLRDFTFAAKAGARNASASGSGVGGKGGALLLSVVGAKMSEGINFSDDLARYVATMHFRPSSH